MNETLPIDFQDVDFCLRLRTELGRELIYDPTYPLMHIQSATRAEEGAASGYTVSRMEFLWGPQLAEGDPYYNPHLSLRTHDLALETIPTDPAVMMARLRPRFRAPQ